MFKQSKQTVDTIANGATLAAAIVIQLAGDAVANTLDGTPVSKTILEDVIASRIHARFATYTSKGVQS